MELDHLLRVFAVGQLIITTLWSGSSYLKSRSEIDSCLDGPWILPPRGNETSLLWDIVCAFREGVEIGISRENYTSSRWEVLPLSTLPVFMGTRKKEEPYYLSLKPAATFYAKRTNNVEVQDVDECANKRKDQAACNYEVSLSTLGGLLSGNEDEARKVFVRAHAANQFSHLRSMFGITETSYRKSLLESGPYIPFQTNSKGAARTGAVFFFTRDGAFLVKTIKKEEALTLLYILPNYCSFMETNGRHSLLTRFCGMYDVCFGGECRTLVVMNSVFPASASKRITKRFDLKGSTVGRVCSSEERMTKGSKAVLKDQDLVREMNVGNRRPGTGFSFGLVRKARIFLQIERDVAFLNQCGVIDYSLLVGIEPCERRGKAANAMRVLHGLFGGASSRVYGGQLATVHGELASHPVIYYLGLIDFLQPFNGKKKMEYKLKSLVYEKHTFSCVPPDVYARRLVSFLDKAIN